LLAKGIAGLTAWDRAAYNGNKGILETLWGWGSEVQLNRKMTFYGQMNWYTCSSAIQQ